MNSHGSAEKLVENELLYCEYLKVLLHKHILPLELRKSHERRAIL